MLQRATFVPIDIDAVASQLGTDGYIVFGRLYHNLDPKYAPPKEEGKPTKHLFSGVVGDEVNCVNFPMLEAVLAGLWQQHSRDQLALWAAVFSLGVSLASLLIAILT
jgi:hypothetical protein